jgi:methionine-rich copper-binding protein CopC
MKKLLVAAIGILCATAIVVQAQDAKPPKKEWTPEQQAVVKEMLAKYDANKNGKLDKEERAKMTQEDKDKMAKAGLAKGDKPAHHAEASTNAPAATDKK